MKVRYTILALLVVLSLVLSACGAQSQPSVVRIGWLEGPDSLNIGVAWLGTAYTISGLTYSTMYKFNLDGTFSFDLGTAVSHSEDGLVYTFTIRDGVKFHDGQPLTAKDVAFTYNLVMAHEDFPTLHSYVEYFESVEAPDDKTVVITLTEAIPNIESKLVYLYVFPEHIWKDHSEGEAATSFENLEMIGSGPFKMLEYKANEFIRLGVNKDFYGGVAKVDEVIFQIFQNADVLVQALKSGQVDMVTSVPNTSVESLKAESNIKVVAGAPFAPNLTDIILNVTDPENCPIADGGLCTGHPALRDKQVRLAMAHATDKQKIIDVVLLGLGEPGIALIPSGLGDWFNSNIRDYEFDVDKANQILDDAGYLDTNNDGVREMPDGSRPLTFRLNWPDTESTYPRIADLLSEMWGEIGITVEMQQVESDTLTAQCCPALDFDIILWGWIADPDPNTLLIIPSTDQIATGYNETGFSNARYDELYAKQGVELDKDKRREMVWEMQAIVHENIPYIIPYYPFAVQAYRLDRFTGWKDSETKVALEDSSSLLNIEPVK